MVDCINTVEPHLTATSVIRSLRYYDHFFLAARRKRPYIFFIKKTSIYGHPLIRPIFIGPLVTVLTGLHCITVWLLEPGHLEEEYPITTFFENKRFSSIFANGPRKFKVQQCNCWKLENRLNLPELSGNSPQIHECYWSVGQKKTWESFVFKNQCDWIIFIQVPWSE